ncbi:MAG: hypothetical protein ACK50Q_11280 [Labrys sp. (in: a-proteobacteria)]
MVRSFCLRRPLALAVAVVATLVIVTGGSPPARAEEAGAIASRALAAGTINAGIGEIEAVLKAKPDDADAQAALGVLRFVGAIERFAQAMYRHGFEPGGHDYGPLLRMPLPVNPNPEKLDYATFRQIFATLSSDLDAAGKTLAEVGDRPVKLRLTPGTWRIDIDGDGKGTEGEALLLLAAGEQIPPDMMAQAEGFTVAFDTADIYWLRGYSNLLGVFADFWLAHDFQETFDATFQVLFPRAGLPNAAALDTGAMIEGMNAGQIADTIALLHMIRWPIAEPARYEAIRQRLLQVIALNRLTWKAAKAETDDDREWLPSPTQKNGVVPNVSITDERLTGWFGALGEAEDVLEGRKMLPHWRFAKGIDVKKLAAEPRSFDLVLWATGHAALPYLADGPVADGSAWAQANRLFDGNLMAYAFWFN